MSNRTWACIDCGKSYRRNQMVESVNVLFAANLVSMFIGRYAYHHQKNQKIGIGFGIFTELRNE
jgi:hypothetical protein